MTIETKTNLRDETLEQLRDLVTINIDASKGFETAAEHIQYAPLSKMLLNDGKRRRAMAEELQSLLQWNGEDAELSGSVKGKLHRWWIDLRGVVQDGDEYPILAEAERGEDAIKGLYEEVLKENPGSAISDVLHKHMRSIKETHDRIRDLRDTHAKHEA